MVSINYSSREVCCKIVYYGPGLSGKTTNLQYVHAKVPGNTRGNLISLATEADRTLYFDFLPINIGTINGFAAKFQLYTVPGQVYYNATRKLVLRGVDGVVFVADSQSDKLDENIESLMNLGENLEEYGYNIDEMPLVIQYNKRDLPGVMSEEELRSKLNPKGRADFGASATVGNGVFDTLKMIIKLVLDKAKSGGKTDTPVIQEPTETKEVSQEEPVAPPRPYPTAEPEGATNAVSSSVSVVDQKPDTKLAASAEEPASVSADSHPGGETVELPDTISAVTKDHYSSVATSVELSTTSPEPKEQVAVVDNIEAESTPIRPFPGSREGAGQRKITPTAFAPSNQMTEGETSYEKNVLETAGDSISTGSSGLGSPSMAPSLKRRAQHKKRGFFKRLFGIR